MVRERSFLMSRALPGEEVEMEARLGVKPNSRGTEGLYWTNSYKFVRKMKGRKTWSNYTHTIVEDVQNKFRRRDDDWSVKKEIRSVLVSNNWAKIALSSEAPSHPPSHLDERKKITRHISRHSFYIGASRVDFTKTYTDGELTHEVEVEYLAPRSAPNTPEHLLAYDRARSGGYEDTYKDFLASRVVETEYIAPFIDLIYSITSAMFVTPLPFTYEMLLTVSAICNSMLSRTYEDRLISRVPYLDRRYFSEATPLDISFLNYSWFFRDGQTWNACLKTDYERQTLVVCDQGTWLLFPPLQAALFSKIDAHSYTRLTIVEGEFDQDTNRFWLIDVLWVDGTDWRGTPAHLTRYDRFWKWHERTSQDLFGGINILYKYHNIITGIDFFIKVREIWESRHGADHKVDGIIFTPDRRYQDSTDERNRIILKWKPEITIDLIVDKDARGTLVAFGAAEDRSEEQFRGNETSKLLGVNMGKIPYNRGAIVEFECKDGWLVALRERPEKLGPNKIDVATSSWLKSTVDSLRVDEDTLLGKNNVLMRKYHNRVKASLIERAASTGEDLVLLDIGSGRGGDLSKWEKHNFSKMICVEPNKKNIERMEARLRTMAPEFQSRVHICNARGEDSAIIKAFAAKHSIDRVDIVSMMDSLTYFFDRDRKSLGSLARTVNSLLVEGGLFIWKSLDGASVRTAFNSVSEDYLDYGDSKITRIDSNTVKVDIPPNQMGLIENLTDVHALKIALDLSGVAETSQGEAMLVEPYMSLSRLYVSGVFTKGKKLAPTREMIEVLRYTSVKKTTQAAIASKSVIEAIEGTFSSYKHSILVSEYQDVARQKDDEYGAAGTEPIYFKFETAYLGFFSSQFIERSKIVEGVLEIYILRDANVDDVHTSLAFASLLKLDVFIVNQQLQLLATSDGRPLTNAIEGRTNNPCCIIISDNDGYRLRPFSNGLPIALSTDSKVSNYPRHPADDFHEGIVESLADIVDETRRGKLLSTNTRPATNVLDRIAHVEGVLGTIRLISLANILLNRTSNGCTVADLESCGIGGDYPSLIAYVNREMKKLREAR